MQASDPVTISPTLHKSVQKLMGNRFEITVVDDDASRAAAHITAAIEEIRRIEALLTTFNESSQTSLINRNAGIAPVKVDQEVFDLIHRLSYQENYRHTLIILASFIQ